MPSLKSVRFRRLLPSRKSRTKKSIKRVVTRMIRTVVGRPEMKCVGTYEPQATIVIDPTNVNAALIPNCPIRGNTFSTRASDKIIVRGYELRIHIVTGTAITGPSSTRLFAFKWRNVDNQATPNVTSILADTTAGPESILSQFNPVGVNCYGDKGRKAFTILRDKYIALSGQQIAAAANASSTAGGDLLHKWITWRFHFPQGIPVNFGSSSSSTTSVVDNWFGSLIWQSVSTGTFEAVHSIYFTDCA